MDAEEEYAAWAKQILPSFISGMELTLMNDRDTQKPTLHIFEHNFIDELDNGGEVKSLALKDLLNEYIEEADNAEDLAATEAILSTAIEKIRQARLALQVSKTAP